MQKTLLPIQAVARKLELPDKYFEALGSQSGKVNLELLTDPAFKRHGKLIIVTATTPAAGEGKTVTSISLTQGLAHIGKKVIITSREPSLGPVFGMKGGAAGGGLSQIEPSAKIDLHFHGDFHAISSAHNLLAALIDAHLFHGNDLQLDPDRLVWPRTILRLNQTLRRSRKSDRSELLFCREKRRRPEKSHYRSGKAFTRLSHPFKNFGYFCPKFW
jgi:formate--tetrahydrofolate ligase